MPTTIKAASEADFLALVPPLLGYTPRESVVFIPFAGPRSIGAMRFDLPETDLHQVASTMTGHVCRVEGVSRVAVIVYTDGDSEAQAPLCLAIERTASRCGLELVDVHYVTPAGYGSLLHHTGPLPLSDIPTPPGNAPVVADGDQAAGASLPEVTEAERDEVLAATVAVGRAIEMLSGEAVSDDVDTEAIVAVTQLDDLVQLFELALTWEPGEPTAYDAAVFLWLLNRPAMRDIGLVTWTQGQERGDEAFEAQLAFEDGVEYPADLAKVMWGDGSRPQGVRLEAALAWCRRVAALAPDGMAAGPLATVAWLSWALGRSTHAEVYARLALEANSEHGLAEIIVSFVQAGHLPDWAFTGRSL